MEFRKIQYSDKRLIDCYQEKYPCYGSTYSYGYLSSWEYFNFESMEIAEEDSSLILRFWHNGHFKYLAQLTSKEKFPSLVDKIFEHDEKASIVQVEMDYAKLVDENKYDIIHIENYDEYLYSSEDLIDLKGKKYHGKRNHIKKFMTRYPDFVYRDYESRDREAIERLFYKWEEEKGIIESAEIEISSEKRVTFYYLDNLDSLGMKASLIEVDGKVVGFTVGEVTSSNVGVVHIEKCDISYDGIYPTLNMLFAKENFQNVTYINRQEDLGIEGLRRAKRSYYPIRMSEKCIIQRKID